MTEQASDSQGLVPNLRFPEFRGEGAWLAKPLRQLCTPISEKVGNAKLTPVSITAGKGFVSQASKFGRDISGDQYRNYTYLRKDDFAYNKGNSTAFPQGYVCQLTEFDEAAASSAFLCFRLNDEHQPRFLQALFDQNVHGRQLASFITSGARSNGLLNIRSDDFYGVKMPFPPENTEQRKIADCLSSLDTLIAAETGKLAALQDHKKGLMRRLFPAEGETTPRLRFPEFENAGEWEERPLGSLLKGSPAYGVNAPAVSYNASLPTYLRITDISEDGRYIHESKVSVAVEANPENSMLHNDIALVRTGSTVGKSYLHNDDRGALVFAGFLIRIRPDSRLVLPQILYQFLQTEAYWSWVAKTSPRSGQPGLNSTEYASLMMPLPKVDGGDELSEQQRIADCLASLDALTTALSEKIDALKIHKNGLLQQLFPSPDEAVA